MPSSLLVDGRRTATLPLRGMIRRMCSLCGTLYSSPHWVEAPGSEAAGEARRARLRERLRRVSLLRRVLAPLALTVDDWEGTAYVLSDRTGRSVLCADLGQLFLEAALLARRPLDPLDPDLLSAIGAA